MFRPMLAAKADLSTLGYPVLVSYKLDGVRALVKNGVLLSRTLKPIPNRNIQASLGRADFEGFDGELIVGSPTDPDVYRNTVSQVMTQDGSFQGVHWLVFDRHDVPGQPYFQRYLRITSMRHEHKLVSTEAELLAFEQQALGLGYEGLILRSVHQPYKFGRSTLREGGMLKLKRFQDAEAPVIAFEELYHNANPATLDERGYTKHSHHQEWKVPMDTLGALVLIWEGQLFRVGTGFSQAERAEIWHNQKSYLNRVAKFKYLSTGMKDLPRHPVFLGWRSSIDTGEVGVA